MIAEFVKQGVGVVHKNSDSYEAIHGENGLGLELTIQLSHLKTIGQAFESIDSSKVLDNLPVDFVRGMGYLVQFHVELSQVLSDQIQSSVQGGE